MRIMQLLQKKRNYRMAGQDTLRIEAPTQNVAHRVVRVKELLKELGLYRINSQQ
jgi:transcription-repair coupling factor (superfamily II helicase)